MSIEARTYVTALYAGSPFPEEGAEVRVEGARRDPDYLTQLAAGPEDRRWFAIDVSTSRWQKWTTEEGDVAWRPVAGERPMKYRIYPAGSEVLTLADIEAMGPDVRTVAANMRGNHWTRVVRTRLGNYQPLEDGDVLQRLTTIA